MRSHLLRTRAHVALVLVLLGLATACGASQRERTVATALTATNAARDAFIKFDRVHQQKLVETASSVDDGRTRLDAYRRQRDPIVQGFATAYQLVATAAVLTDDPKAIPNMLQAVALLKAALNGLTGSTP